MITAFTFVLWSQNFKCQWYCRQKRTISRILKMTKASFVTMNTSTLFVTFIDIPPCSRGSVDSAWGSWSMGSNPRVIGDVRKGIRPQLLLCSKDISVPRPAQKNTHSEFLTGYGDSKQTRVFYWLTSISISSGDDSSSSSSLSVYSTLTAGAVLGLLLLLFIPTCRRKNVVIDVWERLNFVWTNGYWEAEGVGCEGYKMVLSVYMKMIFSTSISVLVAY